MTLGKLYGPTDNARVFKSLLAAEYNGIELDTTPGFQITVDTEEGDYVKKFPTRRSPGFEGKDGLILSESAAIAFHIAQQKEDTTLLGANKNELAKIWQHILFGESSLIPPIAGIYYPILGYVPHDDVAEKNNWEELHRNFTYLNNVIGDKQYLVGNTVTLADINTLTNLIPAYKIVLTSELRQKYANVTRYFEGLLSLPEFKKIVGDIPYPN